MSGLTDKVGDLFGGIFDSGGILRAGKIAVNKSGKPEAVLTADQWANLRRLIDRVLVGGSAAPINAGFLRDRLARTGPTPQQLKDRYGQALAAYRRQLEEALAARERLTAAERRARDVAKRIGRTERTLIDAQGELAKLATVRDLEREIAAERAKAKDRDRRSDPNVERVARLREELRERIQTRIERIRDRLRDQHATEREINKLVRTRTKDYEEQRRQADRARDAAQRAADAYAEAQREALERARTVRQSVLDLVDISNVGGATGLVRSLRSVIQVARRWSTVVKRLIRAGLRGPVLSQIIEGGPSVESTRLGRSLLQSGTILKINRLQDELARIAQNAGAALAVPQPTGRAMAAPRQADRILAAPRQAERVMAAGRAPRRPRTVDVGQLVASGDGGANVYIKEMHARDADEAARALNRRVRSAVARAGR